jgi:hypothetical protein
VTGPADSEEAQAHENSLPLDDRRSLEVGRFLQRFGMLENVVALTTWAAMEVVPQFGPHATGHLTLGQTTRLLRGVAKSKFEPSFADRIASWVKDVDRVAIRRNELVHSPWISHPFDAEASPADLPPDDVPLEKLSLRRTENRLYSVTLREVRQLRVEVERLTASGLDMQFTIIEASLNP